MMYAIMMAVEPRSMNQVNTLAGAVLQIMNARQATATDRIRAGSGTPLCVVFAKTVGARSCVGPKTVREAWNKRQLVRLQALVLTTALTRSVRKGMSRRFMAMTKGDLATPVPFTMGVIIDGSLYGTSRPTAKTERMKKKIKR